MKNKFHLPIKEIKSLKSENAIRPRGFGVLTTQERRRRSKEKISKFIGIY